VCLECGHDLTRSYRRAPGTKTWIALGIAAILAIGVGVGFAVGALTNDKQKDDAKVASSKTDTVPSATAIPPAALNPSTPSGPSGPTGVTGPSGPSGPTGPSDVPTTPAPSAPVPPATATPQGGGDIQSWPGGTTAYTVVLVSAKNKQQANAKAREAISRGIDAGVLHSNNYSSLNPGYWVVFAGQYGSADQARSKIDDYASKGFPGSYPRQVKP
jgi:hypothetical protein